MAIDYELNSPSSEPIIWAFDLGKGSIDEAVRQENPPLRKTSLRPISEFEKDKTTKHEVWRFCLRNAFEQVYPHGG